MPFSCLPMKLRASATPIEAPTPAVPPMAAEKAALTTFASIVAVLVALRATLPVLESVLPCA